MKNLLKLHIKFILALLMTLTMLVMLPACSSTGSTEEAPSAEAESCAAACEPTDDNCIDRCYQNM